MNNKIPLLTLAISVVSHSVWAQSTASEGTSLNMLEEIVVTAQRRSESWQDVPISVDVSSGEELERAGIARLEDLSLVAPAVQVSRIGVYNQPAIRGITTNLAGNYENNVAIYVDGYYLPFGRGLNADLANVQQVQVLKGPQGTLFGRNATGGAILVETLSPDMETTTGRLKASYGRFNTQQIQGYFSTPVTENLAWNLAVSSAESDGHIQDVQGFDTAPTESYTVSSKLKWEPTESLSATLKYETMKIADGRALALTYEGRSLAAAIIPGTYLETRDNKTSVGFPVENTNHQHNVSAQISYDFGFATLNSNTSFLKESNRLHYDLDGTAAQVFEQRTRDTGEAFGQDINLTSNGDGALQYVAGLYYFDVERNTLKNESLSIFAGGTSYLPSSLNNSETEAYAAYLDLTYQLTEKLYLTGGIRYSDETQYLTVNCPTITTSCSVDPLFDGEESFDAWTSRAVIRYELTDDSTVYASYSQGFKSGLINLASPYNRVEPEEIDAFEIGYKNVSDSWRLDVASYYYDYTDLQVSSLQIINGENQAITTNAAEAEIYGAEAQFTTQVGDNFNITFGVAYTHARYSDFPNASYNEISSSGFNTTSCVNGNPPPTVIPCTQDWSDQRITRAPDWTGNIGADYTLNTGVGTFVLGGNVFYTSEFTPVRGDLYTGTNDFRYDQGAYSLVNLQLSYIPAGMNGLTLSLYGKNVLDEDYYFYRGGNVFGDYHVSGQPVSYGAGVDFVF